MRKNTYIGKLVAVDGPNGVGKSTIIQGLKYELEKRGVDVYFTKEPTEDELGTFVRVYAEKNRGLSIACLVAANRYQHLNDEIVPQLKNGKIVIIDRYVLSSLILQKIDKVPEDFILAINDEIIQPDLQIAVFAKNSVIQNRLKQRDVLTRFEKGNKTKIELENMERGTQILKEKEINILQIDNSENLQCNINKVVQEILCL